MVGELTRNGPTCSLKAVVYNATCPRPKVYVGLLSRELKIRVRDHIRDILAVREDVDVGCLKPILRHFRKEHYFKFEALTGLKLTLEVATATNIWRRWRKCIWTLKTLQLLGLNETPKKLCPVT